MGNASWSPQQWVGFSRSAQTQTQAQVFSSSSMKDKFNPAKIAFRESVDSAANPASTPIIIGFDQTGSMGDLPEMFVKTGLGVVMEQIYNTKPVTDPHIMCAAIGDSYNREKAPLQVTQFEADIRIAEQLTELFLEGNGGGNGGESYPLIWYFAAHKTKCDAMSKRGRKGYLFTVGDECPHSTLSVEEISTYLGMNISEDVNIKDLLAVVEQNWEVFHLIVKPVNNQNVVQEWKALLGERAVLVDDHTKLAEVISSTMRVIEGHNIDDVVNSWDKTTGIVVRSAVSGLVPSSKNSNELVVL